MSEQTAFDDFEPYYCYRCKNKTTNHNQNKTTMASTTTTQNNITATNLPLIDGRFAIVLDDVFSPDECHALIKRAETQGYEQALVNVGGGRQSLMTDLRSGDRCIIDDESLADDLFYRIKTELPQEKTYSDYFGKTKQVMPLVGLNERLRFLKYPKGGYFQPHYDGCYSRPDGSATSYMTVMVYLNDGDVDFAGGKTCLLYDTTRGASPVIAHTIIPKPGRVLIFDHDIYHVGEYVTKGTKLCIRTDVMFANEKSVW